MISGTVRTYPFALADLFTAVYNPTSFANPQTKNLDYRGFDSNLNFEGWNSKVHGEFPMNLESMILSLLILSMWTGRKGFRRWGVGLHHLLDQ